MNFDKRDEMFVQIATNQTNRENAIRLLQKARNFSFIPMTIGVFVSGMLMMIDVFSKRSDMTHVLGFITAMTLLMVSAQLDTTIKMLKLAGVLQEAQQTKVDATNAVSVVMTSSTTL